MRKKERDNHINRLAKRFFDLDLATKFSLMFSGMVLVVLLFTALVMSNSGLRYARSQQDARCTLSLDYARILIEKDQSYMDGLTEYYISSSEAQELVKLSNAGQEVPRERSQELLQSARFKMSLLSVVFFNVRGEPIDFVAIDNSYGPVPQSGQETERPFDRLMNSYNSMEWEYVPRYSTVFMEMDHSPKIVLWKKIEDSNTQRAIGVIAVSLDVRKLLGANMDAHSASNTLLLSYDGEVALNRTGYELPGELVAGICAGAGGGPGVRAVELGGVRSKLYYQACTATPFISCVIERDSSSSFWTDTSVIRSAFMLIILFLLAMLPLTRVFAGMLTRPLNKLSESMVRFSKGDYGAKADFRYMDDIGRLGRVFNNMVEENRRLVELNYVMKLKEKEAELSMLQMQMDPHFLYNMLHTAYWSAMKNHDEQTGEIVYEMGQFFRLSLNRGGETSSVRNCLDLLRYYLELQRHRFGSRIQWKIEADREIYDALIPRLILQPLVENCIIHGMDSAGANFFIYIEARMSEGGEDLNFLVEDNGVGFPEELLACWPDRLDEYFKAERPDTSGGQRFALRNIYERLKIRYQERGEFSIRNRPGGGASVFLSLPNDYKEV